MLCLIFSNPKINHFIEVFEGFFPFILPNLQFSESDSKILPTNLQVCTPPSLQSTRVVDKIYNFFILKVVDSTMKNSPNLQPTIYDPPS